MKLRIESDNLEDYLKAIPPVIQFDTPLVKNKIAEIKTAAGTAEERARLAFEIARDSVSHSFDSGNQVISISAEDALMNGDGICFAKAHLLAALLRGMGIPAGFCYQRVLKKGTVESGYALHGLNALYLEGIGWFRVDPRGNKAGIDSQFNYATEQLAYPIRTELGEVDYPDVLVAPLPSVIESMRTSDNCRVLFDKRPESLNVAG
ncbi:MAG: transglutaminase family protein [Saprospiraceae bacterium]|nr:transglutaminase family protein [Saprospiraceae bacterium]